MSTIAIFAGVGLIGLLSVGTIRLAAKLAEKEREKDQIYIDNLFWEQE